MQRRVLEDLVARLGEGRGGGVWITGEAGIGKSTLIKDGLRRAEELGCEVFVVTAQELLPTLPLGIMLNALGVTRESTDGVRGEVARSLYGNGSLPAGSRDLVAVAAEQVLALVDEVCAANPVVLVLDDAQWADIATLGVWQRLSRTVRQLPLLLVTACRPVPLRAEVDALQVGVIESGAVVIEMTGLDQAEAERLVADLVGAPPSPGLAAHLGFAGGNPLYLREVVLALRRDGRITVDGGVADLVGDGGELPGSLPAAIARHLGFLSPAARSMMQTATVLGPGFSVDELSALTGQAATDLIPAVQEAITAGVLVDAADGLTYRHGLIHRALYEGMAPSLRAALHHQAARALAVAGVPAERVAEQLLARPTTVDDWMIDWVGGNATALTRRDAGAASQLLSQVRAAVPHTDPRRDHIDADLAMAQLDLGQYSDVAPLAEGVLARTTDHDTAGRMTHALYVALHSMGRDEQALDAIREVLGQDRLTPAWAARAHAPAGGLLAMMGRFDEARPAAAEAEALARMAGDQTGRARAVNLRSVIAGQRGDHEQELAGFDEALSIIGDDPDASIVKPSLLGNRSAALANLGRSADAEHAMGVAIALADGTTPPYHQTVLLAQAADLRFFLAHWDEALADAVVAELPSGLEQRVARGIVALIALHRDDQTSMRAQFSDIDELLSMRRAAHLGVAPSRGMGVVGRPGWPRR
jgi:tetratricopeptide (TPR) repeat protein